MRNKRKKLENEIGNGVKENGRKKRDIKCSVL